MSGVDQAGELEPLLAGAGGEQVGDLLHQRPEVEAGLLHGHLAGLDLGEVEDVVDEAVSSASALLKMVRA